MNIVSPSCVQIDYYWPQIAPYLAKACARTGSSISPAWLYQRCKDGHSNLLLGLKGDKVILAAIVTFETWGGKQVAHLNAMGGGNLNLWKQYFPALADWCAMHGAKSVVYSGPKAYARLFPKAKVQSMTYSAEIKQ